MTPKTPNSTINRNASTKILTGIVTWIMDSAPWGLDSAPWIPDFGPWVLDSAPWIQNSGFHELYSGFQPQDSGFHKKKFPRCRNTDSLTWGDWFSGLDGRLLSIYTQHKWRVWFYNFFHLYFDRKHRPSWEWMAWKRVSRLYKNLKFKYKLHAT